MAQFATEEWIKLWADAINNSAAYEAAAQTWEGDFYMIVEAGGPIKEPVHQYIDLWHGKCRKATVAKSESEYKPELVHSAPQAIWRRVAEKKLDPIQALGHRFNPSRCHQSSLKGFCCILFDVALFVIGTFHETRTYGKAKINQLSEVARLAAHDLPPTVRNRRYRSYII